MKDIDYKLIIDAEKVRYQSDFSCSHWLFQVIASYQEMQPCKMRDAFESVLRVASKSGIKKALELAEDFNKKKGFPGFPQFLNLDGGEEWEKTKEAILKDWNLSLKLMGYKPDGD